MLQNYKHCTIFIKVIKYAKTHQYSRFIQKFINNIETTWTILKLFLNYCFCLYQNFSSFPSHKRTLNTWIIVYIYISKGNVHIT